MRLGKSGNKMSKAETTLRRCYKNKRIMVTGHTGFKGSWLSFWLKELGAEVISYALDRYTQGIPCNSGRNAALRQ
jgi:FlaA1/EpsC-like NDP-sugar epimerase